MESLDLLSTEFAYYSERQAELLAKHRGQFAVIKNRQLVGVYPTAIQAHAAGLNRFPFSRFLVRQIVETSVPASTEWSERASLEIERLTRERDALAALLKLRRRTN